MCQCGEMYSGSVLFSSPKPQMSSAPWKIHSWTLVNISSLKLEKDKPVTLHCSPHYGQSSIVAEWIPGKLWRHLQRQCLMHAICAWQVCGDTSTASGHSRHQDCQEPERECVVATWGWFTWVDYLCREHSMLHFHAQPCKDEGWFTDETSTSQPF